MMSIKHYIFFLHFFKNIKIKYIGDYMSKESFKTFARNNPELSNSVLENKVTWQQLYELYEIYGEDNSVWNKYLTKKETSIKDIIDNIKNNFKSAMNEYLEKAQKYL